ncbi:DUF4157 domain-containing protein [Laspinema sp. A4]|uniref:eCIS core domain-containing protein n=1 Tax=Laspinema sp. D2d TaxID=2953686 RepID=UPI0021BA9E5A|nr:DUF4157 domain-containing protein [Laspinema sp. D2d]MCT7986339.1 DUF4157 domain-containing protein [Laspinema sp. D2d]
MAYDKLQKSSRTSSPPQGKAQFIRPFAKLPSTDIAPDAPQQDLQRSPETSDRLARISIYPPASPPPFLQPKLEMGAPGDKYEQEADQVARQVVNTIHSSPQGAPPAESLTPDYVQRQGKSQTPIMKKARDQKKRATTTPDLESSIRAARGSEYPIKPEALREQVDLVQTKPLAQFITPWVQREVMPEEEKQPIQRKSSPTAHTSHPTASLESRLNQTKSGGNPLPQEVRSFMEPRFGADFSPVRVHTGPESVQMNRELNAQAFTHSNHIYFGEGKSPGLDLLTAHELTHVVQQTGTTVHKKSSSEFPTLHQQTPNLQCLNNEFASFLDLNIDPRNGLQPHQQEHLDNFVAQVEDALQSWELQRGKTENLRFQRYPDIALAFTMFRVATAADPYHALIWREAARRLESGKNKAYIQEIRMFNPTMLGDLKRMLNIEDVEASHTYEIQPLWGAAPGWSGFGVKVGAIAKRVNIRYTNSLIPGLSWTQQVSLNGFQLGFGLSFGDMKGPNPLKGSTQASISGPGDWEPAEKQPQQQYLEPNFFNEAEFTAPQVSASISLGPATGKKNFGNALLLSKGMHSILWESPAEWSVIDEVEASIPEYGEEVHEGPELNGGIEAVNEFGTTETIGETKFEAGEWKDLENIPKKDSDVWVPLHYARIFFQTGSAALKPGRDFSFESFDSDRNFATIDRIINAIYKWDKKEGYRGSIFKVEISGSHSQKWEQFDDQLKAIEEKRQKNSELTKKEIELEGDIKAKKEMENYNLALNRAKNVHEIFSIKLGEINNRMVYGVMAQSSVSDPTTHEPVMENPYSNFNEDRSVTILVSYQIFNSNSQVNWNQSYSVF